MPEKGQDNVYMLRKIVKWIAIAAVAVVVLAGGLYAFGLRVVLYGGGTPRLRFVESERTRTERIAKDRASHRDVPPPAAVPVDTAPAAAPVTMGAAPAQAPAPTDTLPAASHAAPSYWTDFRGPHRDGHYRERPILTVWPGDGLKPLWKQPVGGGYASFVIARGRAFTIEQRDTQEVVAAYDLATGRQLWTAAWTALFREGMGGNGPRATPTWADGRVYALGAMGELRCLDETTGQTFWRANILEDAGASNLQWGMAAAPLIVDDTVIVVPGGGRGRSVAAYDRKSGKRAWSALDDQAAYSSPMLVTIDGVRQVLVFSASRLVAISPEHRTVLWEYPWKTNYDVNAAQPLLIGENRVFISSGYGAGGAVIEVTRSDDAFSVREIWRNNRMKNQFTSSVLHEGFIYGLDEAILACLDAATGAVKWKGGRYGYGQIMLASGHLIVLTEEGDLVLVRATPDSHQEVGRFSALNGKTWNHPAMSGGYLLVRNINDMAAFDLRVSGK